MESMYSKAISTETSVNIANHDGEIFKRKILRISGDKRGHHKIAFNH